MDLARMVMGSTIFFGKHQVVMILIVGEQVLSQNFAVNHQSNGWDGRFLGQWVLPGVYVYLIKLIKPDGSVLVLNGDISVIR